MSKKSSVQQITAQKQEELERAEIAEIQKACPLVQVQGENSASGWRIRGLVNGESILDVKAYYLKAARTKFHDAYSVVIASGIIKKPK